MYVCRLSYPHHNFIDDSESDNESDSDSKEAVHNLSDGKMYFDKEIFRDAYNAICILHSPLP